MHLVKFYGKLAYIDLYKIIASYLLVFCRLIEVHLLWNCYCIC